MIKVNATSAGTKTADTIIGKGFSVNATTGEVREVETTATVTFQSGAASTVPYQQQIDDINAQLPVKDVEVVDTTNLNAIYLLARGN